MSPTYSGQNMAEETFRLANLDIVRRLRTLSLTAAMCFLTRSGPDGSRFSELQCLINDVYYNFNIGTTLSYNVSNIPLTLLSIFEYFLADEIDLVRIKKKYKKMATEVHVEIF